MNLSSNPFIDLLRLAVRPQSVQLIPNCEMDQKESNSCGCRAGAMRGVAGAYLSRKPKSETIEAIVSSQGA